MARIQSAIFLLALSCLLQMSDSAPHRTKRSNILSFLGLEPPPFNETYVGRIFDSVADRVQEATIQVMGMAVQSAIGNLFGSGSPGMGGFGLFGGDGGLEFGTMNSDESKGRDISARQPMNKETEMIPISRNVDKCIKKTETLGVEAIEEAAQGIENCIQEAASQTAHDVENCVSDNGDKDKCLEAAGSDNSVVTTTAACIERHVRHARNLVNRAAKETLECLQEHTRRRRR